MAGIIKMYDSLKSEYHKAETELKSVDKSLQKLTGKDPPVPLIKVPNKIIHKNNNRNIYEENRNRFTRINDLPRKRKHSDDVKMMNRKNIEPDEKSIKKPSLLSTISVSAPVPARPKFDEVSEKQVDKKSNARNRRMFGMILGTLQKFQTEESQRKETTIKRVEIEKKLDLADAVEKEAVKKEKDTLIRTKRSKQSQLRKIELKMERVKIHQEWEKSHQCVGNFIQTKTKPSIFYIPTKHTPETEKRLKETKDKFKIILAERRAKAQKELLDIENLYKKDDETLNDISNNNDEITESGNKNCKKEIEVDKNDFNANLKINVKNEDVNCNEKIKIEETDNKTEVEHEDTKNLNENNLKEIDNDLQACNSINNNDKSEEFEDKEFEPIYDE